MCMSREFEQWALRVSGKMACPTGLLHKNAYCENKIVEDEIGS